MFCHHTADAAANCPNCAAARQMEAARVAALNLELQRQQWQPPPAPIWPWFGTPPQNPFPRGEPMPYAQHPTMAEDVREIRKLLERIARSLPPDPSLGQ